MTTVLVVLAVWFAVAIAVAIPVGAAMSALSDPAGRQRTSASPFPGAPPRPNK